LEQSPGENLAFKSSKLIYNCAIGGFKIFAATPTSSTVKMKDFEKKDPKLTPSTLHIDNPSSCSR